MNNAKHPSVNSIFSEDVKDPSLFLIESSDEDDNPPIEYVISTPKRGKPTVRGKPMPRDVLSDKVDRQARLDDELYDKELNTDPILTEINMFFEKSVASLVAEETKQTELARNMANSIILVEDGIEVLEGINTVVSVPARKLRKGKDTISERRTKTVKQARKRTKRPKFKRDVTISDDSDEEYLPDGTANSVTKKRVSRRRSNRSHGEGNTPYVETFVDHLEQVESDTYDDPNYYNTPRGKGTQHRGKYKWSPSVDASVTGGVSGINVLQLTRIVRDTNGNDWECQLVEDKQLALDDEDHEQVEGQGNEEAHRTQTICLKFVILDENRSIIKDDRLQKVYVNRNETMGSLGAKFGKLFNLGEEKYKDIIIYIDGDPQPQDIAIGDEMLGVEEGMQIDIKFPPKRMYDGINEFNHNILRNSDESQMQTTLMDSMKSIYTPNTPTNAKGKPPVCEIIEIE